jgi:outer membrane protein TolC
MRTKMKNIKHTIFILLFLFGINLLPNIRLNLSDAIKLGLRNNYDIKIAKETLNFAELNNNWGTAGRYPSINLSLNSVNTINDDPSKTIPAGDRDKFNSYILSPAVNLNWVLFRGFSVQITKSKLNMLNKINAVSKEIVVENTIQAIILSYYKVILEREKLLITKKMVKLSKDRYNYVLSRKDLGLAVSYEVLNAKIAYLSDKANLLKQEMNLNNAKRTFKLVLGEDIDKKISLSEKFENPKNNFDMKRLLTKLYKNNKNLKNQYINQEILKNEIRLNKASYYPTVSLNSGISMNSIGIKYPDLPVINSKSYDYYVNFSISLNLFNGGNTRRAVASAKINERIGSLKISELRFSLKNRLNGLFDLYKLRKNLLDVSEENIKSAKLNLKMSLDRLKSGAISSFNYRDIQILYMNTAFGKLQALYNMIDTSTEILRLTGELASNYIK